MTTTITDDTPLAELLSSPKNVKLLDANGIKTVADVRASNVKHLLRMGVGEMTLEEIRAIGSVEEDAPEEEPSIEESNAPLMIRSPYKQYALQVCPGDAVRSPTGRGTKVIQPVYLVCRNGVGRLTREQWFHRVHNRDKVRVEEACAKNEPWRVKAAEWLKSRKNHGKLFFLMSD